MQLFTDIVAVILGYILGSIPFGLMIVKLKTGKDLRTVESGRTGGTNAARAAGFWAGLLTAILDILKGAGAVWLAKAFDPTNHVLHVLAPLGAILGHNYSLFLIERDENGKLRFRGGAGGAPALGGAMGLWLPMFPIAFGLGALIWFSIGIASLTTMAIGLVLIIIFAFQALQGNLPSIYILYGVIAESLLIWALRPNIKKLLAGNERVIGISLNGWLRARKQAKEQTGKS
ncbi:MAG TPA: glycerol-3-phosphate acyltransferase [Anaerolineales bacterium]|nr:glycerol-3-phosphate acyltransferase [Anaerolineales bacterium]